MDKTDNLLIDAQEHLNFATDPGTEQSLADGTALVAIAYSLMAIANELKEANLRENEMVGRQANNEEN